MVVAIFFGSCLSSFGRRLGDGREHDLLDELQSANQITFANLDGSGAFGILNTTGVTPNEPEGVAIDPAHNRIYWANWARQHHLLREPERWRRWNAQHDPPTTTVNHPFGVAIDPAQREDLLGQRRLERPQDLVRQPKRERGRRQSQHRQRHGPRAYRGRDRPVHRPDLLGQLTAEPLWPGRSRSRS